MNDQQLIFVYNADGSIFSRLTDVAHKILSPATYSCSLCALTYGDFTMKEEWKLFIKGLPLTPIFFYRDEFEKAFKIKPALPAIFLCRNKSNNEIVSKQEIESCRSLEELKCLVKRKIEVHVQHHHPNV